MLASKTPVEPRAKSGVAVFPIVCTGPEAQIERNDSVVVEAPLETMLHHPALGVDPVSFGTTMRTPGGR